jgi:hypothetical protein
MTEKAISPLRQRLVEDMTIRRLGPKTQHDYVRHVKSFADFLGRSPDKATAEDVCMSIGTSCGRRRSERPCRPSMSLPLLCGSSSGSR